MATSGFLDVHSAFRRALEAAGVMFIDENGGGGPGVQLRRRQRENA
jgi:hypothetical protein